MLNQFLVLANENGNIQFTDEAAAFVQRASGAIRQKLNNETTRFALMPYRYNYDSSQKYLGFDWEDDLGETISFTFFVEEQPNLPNPVSWNCNDVCVSDFVDALHLCRAIALAVKGDAIGTV